MFGFGMGITKNKNNSEIKHLALIVLIILSVSIIALTVLALGAYALPQKPIVLQQFPANNSYFNNPLVFSIKYSEKNLAAVKLNLVIKERTGVETGNISYELNCTSGIPVKCGKAVNVLAYDGKIIEYFFEVSNQYTTAKTQKRTIFIDATAPSITISSPVENKIYNVSRIDIVGQSSEEVKWMKKAVNNNIFTIICTRCNSTKSMQFFNEGSQMFSIQALDKAGNLANKIISFTVDSRKPLVLSQSPITNKVLNGTVNFSVSYTEINLKNVTLYVLNSTNAVQEKQLSCEAGTHKKCTTAVDLSDFNGTLSYYFNLRDSVNDANSRIVNFKVKSITKKNISEQKNESTLSPLPLSNVSFWAYQIQGQSNQGAVDALANSKYDLLVIDPVRTDWSSDDKSFDTKSMVAKLKNSNASDGLHRKLVIAYIDIGEAENWRWYWRWSTEWNSGPRPADWPSYILTQDPDGWTGNFPVAYWDQRWKDIVIYGQNQSSQPYGDYNSILDEVIKDGFDGVYLDWVEGFENDAIAQEAQLQGRDPAVEMIEFIQEIKNYSRQRNPNFIVIQQNAPALIDGHPELTIVIDGIAQEAVWYDGSAFDDWNAPDGYDSANDASLTNYYVTYLNQYKSAGIPIFNVEYAVNYSDDAYNKSYSTGYIPYVTRRPLSQLSTTPPKKLLSEISKINSWAYQLNTYKNDNLDEIKDSGFQVVVIDYSRDGTAEGEFSSSEIASLKLSGKIVLAYMSIGEAETYRYYWQSWWIPGNPSWLDVENPEWAGNFKVKYWEPGWQSVILGGNGQAGYLNKIMDAGFDGVYMDIIDGYEYYQDKGVSDADRKMVEFVKNISAQAKTRNPDFLIFPQNGEALAQYTDYLDAVDGIGVEDTWYNEDVPNNPADVQQKVDNLLKFRNEGKLVLTVDYVSTPQNIADFYDKSRNFGFVPYATVRALDRLTVN